MTRTNHALPVVLACALAGGAAPVAAEPDIEAGKEHFRICSSCHGARGQGNQARGGPRLVGQHGWYLERQLMNFRAGLRGAHEDDAYGQLMAGMARQLPDDQAVRDVVGYILTLD